MDSLPSTSRRASPARRGVALCLSGGGFRAALFHLGAVRRLNELGILATLDTVSAVSGGAILANLLGDARLGFTPTGEVSPSSQVEPGSPVEGFDELVAAPLRRLASRNVRTPALLARLHPRHWGKPDAAVRALADELAISVPWWSQPLGQVVPGNGRRPAIITGATEVAYGVDWRFEDAVARPPRGRMGDYRVGYAVPPAALRVADVVAASCALPPFFAPMVLDGEELGLTGGHPGLESAPERQAIRRRVRLTDGGVYDNLALEPVWKRHRTVLVSDGGSVFRARTEHTLHGRMMRILGIATGGGQSVRVRWLQASYARGVLAGTSWSLDTVPADAGMGPDGAASGHGSDARPYPRSTVELVNAVRTDLDAFSELEQQVLERHGYLVADARLRAHAPDLVRRGVPCRPPHPEVADPAVAAAALARSARRRLLGRF